MQRLGCVGAAAPHYFADSVSEKATGFILMAIRLPNRRARTPTVIQMEAVECGAAALAIVLGHYGRVVPLEQLREECGVSRDGSRALNVIKAATRFGLEAKGFKYNIEKLAKVRLPAILFWNFNHFVVLDGISRRGKVFHINDPARGRRTVAFQQFNESYTGVVLTFQPTSEFRKGGRRPSTIGFLAARLQKSRTAFTYALLCALLLVIPGLIIPAFMRIFIDDFLVGSEKTWIRPLLTGMAIVLLLQMLLTALQQYCLLRFREKLSLAGSGRFLKHILRLPMRYFSQRFAGEIGSRLPLNDEVAGVVGGQLAKISLDLVLVGFFGVLMFFYDQVLALISVSVAVINAAIVQIASRARADKNRIATQHYGKMTGTSINGLQMIETLKASGGEDEFFGRWAGYQAQYLAEKQSLLTFSQYVMTVPTALIAVSTTVVLAVGAFRIMDGSITLGTFVAFQALASQFSGPLNNLIQFANNLQLLGANITRINDVFRAPEDPIYAAKPDASKFTSVSKLSGRLELIDVTFGYSPLEKPLIENFNLSLSPGSRVALVGSSGSGKSTIAKLASGLYRPWSGEVRFDGYTIDEIPRDLFAISVAMVDQDVVLISGSVSDNLTLWNASVPEQTIHQACQYAGIANVIASRTGGYQSELGEGGSNLSGGERQRLEIARALVHSPTLLILDEATSALDAATEMLIDQNLRRSGCASLIVAHRLSTIRDADEIIVMDAGKIVERGIFDELLARRGALFRLMEQ
jgi:ATP-binding cassette subfamily C protein